MAVATAIGVSAAVAVGGAAIADGKAKRDARQARRDKSAAQAELDRLKSQRQDIINPYENVKDLSGMMSNPFAQLGVATQAAEIQMEQSDIALANTLDTIRSTGASAGGATALAQAALESKKGVSASIEQQEVQNEKLRASGQQALEQQKIAESQRIQQLEAAGKQFEFQVQEDRLNADMDRTSGAISQAQANEASARQASASAWSGAISAVGSIGAAAAGAVGK